MSLTSITAFLRKYFSWLVTWFVELVSLMRWHNPKAINDDQKKQLADLLAKDYYLICTHNRSSLGTFMINLSDWSLTGKWGFYNHCLMNLEDTINNVENFYLVEATTFEGTGFNSFSSIFASADSVALLKPKTMTIDKWTAVLDQAKANVGKHYDCLYDFTQDKKLSCIELVRNCLQKEPNYATDYANFEMMLAKYGELTPEMLYDCADFEKVWEVRN